MIVLSLTDEVCAYFRLLSQADGAVGPGAKDGGSHLTAVIWAVCTHDITIHPPPHGGCGDPMERAGALQCLLQGAKGVDQPGRCCMEGEPGGSEVL